MPEDNANQWSEAASAAFLAYGHYFVPDREQQMALIVALIPAHDTPFTVLELACGEGMLAQMLLARHLHSRVIGLDGSPLMRERAAARLRRYGSRFEVEAFDLGDPDWRRREAPVHAVVSSLTIHHLDDAGKRTLYQDIHAMLEPGGAFIVADIVLPVGAHATEVIATAYDDAVRRRVAAMAPDSAPFDHFERSEWNLFRYPDPMDRPAPVASHLQWLTDAGFVDVDIYWLKSGHAIYGGRRAAKTA